MGGGAGCASATKTPMRMIPVAKKGQKRANPVNIVAMVCR